MEADCWGDAALEATAHSEQNQSSHGEKQTVRTYLFVLCRGASESTPGDCVRACRFVELPLNQLVALGCAEAMLLPVVLCAAHSRMWSSVIISVSTDVSTVTH